MCILSRGISLSLSGWYLLCSTAELEKKSTSTVGGFTIKVVGGVMTRHRSSALACKRPRSAKRQLDRAESRSSWKGSVDGVPHALDDT